VIWTGSGPFGGGVRDEAAQDLELVGAADSFSNGTAGAAPARGDAPSAVKVDRSRLPKPGAVRALTLPSIERSILPNRLNLWTVRHPNVPVISLVLLVRGGSATDPAGQEGLAALTADMLDEGSDGRSAIEMHEALARIGAQFDTDIGSDAAVFSITALSRFADRALWLLADMVARPTLAEADFARVRQLRLHRLTQLRDAPGAVADRTFVQLLYGHHPYGHTPIGSQQAIAGLTVDDVRGFHAQVLRPTASTLIAVGDCDHSELARIAAEAFAGWDERPVEFPNSADRGPSATADSTQRGVARLNVVPRPGAPQSELRIGHVAAARNTPDYHALVIANSILGGQFVSRINLNLREDKGFTYGARTAFDFRRMPGPFALQVSVQTAATARAIEESIGEISAIRGPRPVTSEELSLAVATLTKGYARYFETAEQIARAVTQLALYDLPDDYFAEFVPRIERVTEFEATRVSAEYLDPTRLTTLIVGDLDVIGRDLPQLGLGDPVVLSSDPF
jgi:zinc protease